LNQRLEDGDAPTSTRPEEFLRAGHFFRVKLSISYFKLENSAQGKYQIFSLMVCKHSAHSGASDVWAPSDLGFDEAGAA
jgi:hypothetical protein